MQRTFSKVWHGNHSYLELYSSMQNNNNIIMYFVQICEMHAFTGIILNYS